MFWSILWLTAIVISRSQSTEESAVCQPGTQQLCKQQMEWGGQGGHSSTLLHGLTSQEPELELTSRWKGLLLSHNPVIAHRCSNKSGRPDTLWGWCMLSVHQTGMDGVIWEDDRLGAVNIPLFLGETKWFNCCSWLNITAYNSKWYSPDDRFLFSLHT